MQIITPSDVAPFTKSLDSSVVELLVAGVNAQAARVAPCLIDADAGALDEARLILVGAVKRYAEAGSGGVVQQGAGPYQVTVDNRAPSRGYSLWPSEITALQALCGPKSQAQAFSFRPHRDEATDVLASRPDLWFQWLHPTPTDAP